MENFAESKIIIRDCFGMTKILVMQYMKLLLLGRSAHRDSKFDCQFGFNDRKLQRIRSTFQAARNTLNFDFILPFLSDGRLRADARRVDGSRRRFLGLDS